MNLFIGCSANEEIEDNFKIETKKLLDEILKISNINLVFGGYLSGLMKEAFNNFSKHGRKIYAYNVEKYSKNNAPGTKFEIMTSDRFKDIYNKSDVFLILPGGIGTIAELLNAVEENRIQDQPKKIIIYNYQGYYNEFIQYLYKLKTNKFIKENIYEIFNIESDINDIINLIKEEEK